jgi:hypothetical protein
MNDRRIRGLSMKKLVLCVFALALIGFGGLAAQFGAAWKAPSVLADSEVPL